MQWHARRDRCLESDRDYATIYLDGMDQNKTDIPRLLAQDIREAYAANPMKVRYFFIMLLLFFFDCRMKYICI